MNKFFSTSSKSSIFFILGGPGAGKGTQCERLAKDFGFSHISAGELLRNEVQINSETGKLISSLLNKGSIVPAHITVKLLQNCIRDIKNKPILIDGFPRNLDNLKSWNEHFPVMSTFKSELNGSNLLSNKLVLDRPPSMIFFNCSDNVLTGRLLYRSKSSGRSDDNEGAIKRRLKVFHEHTLPLVQRYQSMSNSYSNQLFYDIDGNLDVEVVHRAFRDTALRILDSHASSR